MVRKSLEPPAPEEPPLSEFDRDLIGRSAVRLHIPFAINPYKIRQIAEMFRGLANDMDFVSRELPAVSDPDYARKRRLLLLDLSMRVRAVQARIDELKE